MNGTLDASPRQTHVRWMIDRDARQMLSIDDKTKATPWSEEDLANQLKTSNCMGMVAEERGKVVGFMVYELRKHKLQLLRMGVDPDYTGKDAVGQQLIAKLVSKLSPERRTRLTVEVNERDLTQQQFLRSCGFEAVRTLKDHFPDTGDDAYVMCLRCPDLQTRQPIAGWLGHAPDKHADRISRRGDADEKRQR